VKKNDLHEDLCKYYELGSGTLPNRDAFIDLLRQTVTREELEIFFMMPFLGTITLDKLESRSAKKGVSREQLHGALDKMARGGFVMTYQSPKGRVYQRGNAVFMTEQQVRKYEDTPLRTAYAKLMNTFIEGETGSAPNKTPYYRVLAVEASLTKTPKTRNIEVNVSVPDPRAILPLDIVSKMTASQSLIAVAECYCRKVKKVLGEECEHPLETCLVFNDLAETLIEAGIARKLDLDEALKILADCEAKGLVHNVDNCEDKLRSICNCCTHASILLRTLMRGSTNTMSASRFMSIVDKSRCTSMGTCVKACPVHAIEVKEGKAFVDQNKCIGCGQCVSRCASNAIRLVPRLKYAKIYSTNKTLYDQIVKEAIIGMTLNKITGKK
jgi:Na+-translocating ferredoxin:NAD+ oxidoreductase subunit B